MGVVAAESLAEVEWGECKVAEQVVDGSAAYSPVVMEVAAAAAAAQAVEQMAVV